MKFISTTFNFITRSPALVVATVVVCVGIITASGLVIKNALDNAARIPSAASDGPEVSKNTESNTNTIDPKTAASTQPKAEAPKPATQTTPKPAPSAAAPTPAPAPAPTPSASCTNPVFTTSDTNGGWSTNGYYVHNNMWNVSGYSVSETLYACAYNNWYVTATANNNSGDGAVKTYPNVHKDLSGRTIASFTSLTSSFAATSPSVGIYNVAYDLWLNGIPNDEVMIWTDNFNQYPAGSKFASNVSLSGHTWDVYSYGSNGTLTFVPSGGVRIMSGTIDIKAMLDYLVANGRQSANSTVDQIGYGVEIVSTSGSPATWNFTNFSISSN